MEGEPRDSTAEELLAHAGWLRRLALRLVGDADAADDLVHETWIAASRRGPEARESLRPWLAKVLRDALRMRARSEGRRAAREQAAALTDEELVATPELLVERAEAQRRLVELVLRLAEPYRSAVLLHYYEGVPMAEIAWAQGIPAGTVRWRVKVAIDQVRAWLDEADDRRRWASWRSGKDCSWRRRHRRSRSPFCCCCCCSAGASGWWRSGAVVTAAAGGR